VDKLVLQRRRNANFDEMLEVKAMEMKVTLTGKVDGKIFGGTVGGFVARYPNNTFRKL
jgi:hypothetical protein